MRPSKLISSILGAPGTGEPIKLITASVGADSEPYSGIVVTADGTPVGTLNAFRFDFVDCSSSTIYSKFETGTSLVTALTPRLNEVELFGPRILISDDELVIAQRLRGLNGQRVDAEISLVTCAPEVHIQFHAHGWSGICEIWLNDHLQEEVDLFNQETSIPKTVIVPIKDLSRASVVKMRCSRSINPASSGRQILLERVSEWDGTKEIPTYRKKSSVNHGGAFHPRFLELFRNMPTDAIVVDVGGGKRQLDDPRYINIEYSPYEEPDILGDGTRLPFKTGSIDLIYTAAVLEHVRSPQAMGNEIFRVLKPGGTVIANSAFMQPVHSEGQHFFNSTPYGIRETFGMFPEGKIWWEGSFSDLVKWTFELSGARHKAPQSDVATFLKLANEFDEFVSYERLMYIASGVWFEGVKPPPLTF
jgi:SAM-dependent methyltransferase